MPSYRAFSDPYPGVGLDALSWAIMLAEIAAALAYGLIGLRAIRRRHAGPRRLWPRPPVAPAARRR